MSDREARDVIAAELANKWHGFLSDPEKWIVVSDAVIAALAADGYVLCRAEIEDHPVYPRRVYVPVEEQR